MTINPRDDYESLAKLLYPSIEASGNVYYGQTRKLAVDELFDKNESGFESYFCSCRKEDDSSQYEQHFHWKLGPFSDTVKIVDDDNEYKDYPLAWLKYSLAKKETEHKHVINSGEYKTYEVEYILGQPSLYCSLDGSLPNGDIYDGRSFFLDCDSDNKVLYVLLYKAPVYEDMDKPLYIEALTDDIRVRLVPADTLWPDGYLEQCKYNYGFDYTNLSNCLLLNEDITVARGSRVYFKCEGRPEFSDTEYLQFIITSTKPDAEVAVGGNIESMAKFENEDGDMLDYAYECLFFQNNLITDVSKLYIGKLSNYSCDYLFSECARLKTVSAILPCLELKPHCYQYMFSDCAALENAPILPAKDGAFFCYTHMFSDLLYESTALHEIKCLLKTHNDDYTYQWLDGRTGVEYIRILPDSNWESATSSTKPAGCELVEASPTYISVDDIAVSNTPIEKYLVTHGTDNESNGRGNITDPSTLANMEKSFDENNNHPMNTYNADGSFNQEIWGYKSFCSPVQFRNGIYGEDWSIYTYEYSNSINNTSLVMSRDESQSASIQICEGRADDMRKYSIILSGRKPVDDYLSSDGAIVEISNIRTRVSEHFPYYTRGFITLQANQIQLNGTTKAASITSDTVTADNITADSITSDTVTADNITSDVVYNTTIYTSEISTMAQTSNININCDITSHGDIFALNGKEFIGNLSGEVAKVDKIYTSEIDVSQSSSGINVKSDVTFEKPIYLNGITSQGDIEIDNGKKFIGDLDGVIPYIERDSFNGTVPVGCIVFLKIEDLTADKIWSTYNPYEVGTEFTSNNDGTGTKIFSIGGFGESGMLEDSSPLSGRQTFRTLSRCEFSENGVAYVLAIRVA